MPGFPQLRPEEIRLLVKFVRGLQGGVQSEQVSGNPVRGKELFFGRGRCSSCHMVGGDGGIIGPDLSGYAKGRSEAEILDSFKDPAPDRRYTMAVAKLNSGATVQGMVRNEDNFSVQLQEMDGTYHFLLKSELQALEYQDNPSVRVAHTQKLTPEELNNVAAYLVTQGRAEKSEPKTETED